MYWMLAHRYHDAVGTVGISPSSVGRIWAVAGSKPHVSRGFKVSNDPLFEEKVTEIVGLYFDPPDRAVVLCVDEKSTDTGLGSGPVWLAAQEEARRHDDPRLQAPRHDHPVCRA